MLTPEQFDKLVQILGNIGNLGYNAALQRVYVDGWINLVSRIILLIMGLSMFVWGIKLAKTIWNKERGENE